MKDRAHDQSMVKLFREDPAFATKYLNDVFEESDQADLLVALRQIALAFGGVRKPDPDRVLEALRAALTRGQASGPAQPADAVFRRLEAKYRKLAGKRKA